MCTQPRAARDQGWGTFSRPASWSFLHQLQGQRERRVPRPWLHSALTVLLRPAWSWEMLSKTCSPSALGRLLFPPLHRECFLAAPAALATSSCQTAASRAVCGPGPASSPSARELLPARRPADTLGAGRQGTVAARPPLGPPCPTRRRWGWVGVARAPRCQRSGMCSGRMLKP